MKKFDHLFDEIQVRFLTHRELVIDLVLIWLAGSAVERWWLDQPLPFFARLCAIGVALFILPSAREKKLEPKTLKTHLRRLYSQLGFCLAVGLIWTLVFNLPLRSLNFALIWLPASWGWALINFQKIWARLVALAPSMVESRLDVIAGETLLIF
jgi:hypothetical protein